MKKFAYWFFVVVITLVLSIYQRMTGPTYPKKLTVELRGESYQMKLPRSGVQQDVLVKLPIPECITAVSRRQMNIPAWISV